MNRITILFLFLLISFLNVSGQTFHGTTGHLKDDGTLNDFLIDVQGLDPESLTPGHGISTICIYITHTWISDLDIRLIAPDGTNIMLSSGMGGDADAYDHTCFNMNGISHMLVAPAPYAGTYIPFSNIGNINNGHAGNGVWILRILDTYAYADEGDLLDWSIEFGENAPAPDPFQSSKLPIFVLNTDHNYTIPDNPKISGTYKVIYGGPGATNHLTDPAAWEGHLGVETRGASSQSFPKKSFGFKTRDENGANVDVPFFGLGEENEWILYAPFTDKTFLRDALTYKLGNDLGQYAPHTVFVELYLNGDYQGVYCLEEKIKRDKARLDISKLNPVDTLGDELTGGYLVKVDRDDGDGSYWVSQYKGTDTAAQVRIVFEDPEGVEMHPKQRAYIQSVFDRFEDALYGPNFMDEKLGYRRYIDVPSWVDQFIIQEFGHNVDGYRLSMYFYKDRDSKDSLIHAGPLWDFNLAYGNANYCHCEAIDGWTYYDSGYCGNTPKWWERLVQDTFFQDAVRCRFEELRKSYLSEEYIFNYVDSMAQVFNEAQEHNYTKWPILGIWIWPNWYVGSTYQEEINFFKQWIGGRLDWLETNLPGQCISSGTDEEIVADFNVVPNPANDIIQIKSLPGNAITGNLLMYDMTGRMVMSTAVSAGQEIDISKFPSGSYLLRLNEKSNTNHLNQQKLVIVR